MTDALSRTRYPGPITEARVFPHRIAESGLVTDKALAELLDRYPAELIDINLYDYDAEGQVSLRTGARGRSSGADLLEAIQKGRLWVNLREVERGEPAIWAEVMKAFDPIRELFAATKDAKSRGLTASRPLSPTWWCGQRGSPDTRRNDDRGCGDHGGEGEDPGEGFRRRRKRREHDARRCECQRAAH